MTMGEMIKSMLVRLEWFDTRFPRIPVNVQVSFMCIICELKKKTKLNTKIYWFKIITFLPTICISNILEQPLISLSHHRNKSMRPLIKGATQATVLSLIPIIRRHKAIKIKAQPHRILKALKVSVETITTTKRGLIQETGDQDRGIVSQNLGTKNIEI